MYAFNWYYSAEIGPFQMFLQKFCLFEKFSKCLNLFLSSETSLSVLNKTNYLHRYHMNMKIMFILLYFLFDHLFHFLNLKIFKFTKPSSFSYILSICFSFMSLICDITWWIVFVVWLSDERHFALFSAGTIVRDPHHHESLTHRKQGLNLCRTWVQA